MGIADLGSFPELPAKRITNVSVLNIHERIGDWHLPELASDVCVCVCVSGYVI